MARGNAESAFTVRVLVSGDSSGTEKRDQFVDSEVREGFAVPVHGRGFRLAGELDHFLHGVAVSGDHDGFDFDAFAAEEIRDVVAPRAAGFDVEDGKIHGRLISVVSTGDQEAGFCKFGD